MGGQVSNLPDHIPGSEFFVVCHGRITLRSMDSKSANDFLIFYCSKLKSRLFPKRV